MHTQGKAFAIVVDKCLDVFSLILPALNPAVGKERNKVNMLNTCYIRSTCSGLLEAQARRPPACSAVPRILGTDAADGRAAGQAGYRHRGALSRLPLIALGRRHTLDLQGENSGVRSSRERFRLFFSLLFLGELCIKGALFIAI